MDDNEYQQQAWMLIDLIFRIETRCLIVTHFRSVSWYTTSFLFLMSLMIAIFFYVKKISKKNHNKISISNTDTYWFYPYSPHSQRPEPGNVPPLLSNCVSAPAPTWHWICITKGGNWYAFFGVDIVVLIHWIKSFEIIVKASVWQKPVAD